MFCTKDRLRAKHDTCPTYNSTIVILCSISLFYYATVGSNVAFHEKKIITVFLPFGFSSYRANDITQLHYRLNGSVNLKWQSR